MMSSINSAISIQYELLYRKKRCVLVLFFQIHTVNQI